jgi:hypothetical protein
MQEKATVEQFVCSKELELLLEYAREMGQATDSPGITATAQKLLSLRQALVPPASPAEDSTMPRNLTCVMAKPSETRNILAVT